MDLVTHERTTAASRQHTGDQVIMVSAGQSLKIETSPGGEEVLNVECPAGSSWTVHITIAINELDD